jgi:hypothetical protein
MNNDAYVKAIVSPDYYGRLRGRGDDKVRQLEAIRAVHHRVCDAPRGGQARPEAAGQNPRIRAGSCVALGITQNWPPIDILRTLKPADPPLAPKRIRNV